MVPNMPVLGPNPVQVVDPIVMAHHCRRRTIGFKGRHNVIYMFPTYSMRKKWRSEKATSGSLRQMCKLKLELREKIDFEN
jgi:hypothetical protein